MSDNDPIAARYLGTDYLRENPPWGSEDSAWKANKFCELLKNHAVALDSVVDIGSGCGIALVELRKNCPSVHFAGRDATTTKECFRATSCVVGMEPFANDFPGPVMPLYPEQRNLRGYVLKRSNNCTR